MRRLSSAIGMALALMAAPALAQTVAVTNVTLALGDGSDPVANGTVVMRDGRIVAAGQGISIPSNAERIDGGGKWAAPGMFSSLSRLGLTELEIGGDGANDVENGSSPFSAAIDVSPGVNPMTNTVAASRAGGVTRAIIAPEAARSIFAGQGAVIDLGVDMSPITRARAFQYVELGEEGAAKAGGSRPSAYALFRNALREARDLAGSRQDISGGGGNEPLPQQGDDVPYETRQDPRLLGRDTRRSDDVLLTRFDAAALVPVVRGRQLLVVHVERAIDIVNLIALRREFPSLRMAIAGASEGWTVAPQLAASGMWVFAEPLSDLPASFEQLAATQSNIGRMRAAGVKVAIARLGDTRYARNERQAAANLVALRGVPGASPVSWGEALAMITSRPAEAIGMGGDLGRLAAGYRADLVLWSGDPLENASVAEAVWIDGVRQPITNHQTRLRDRYRDLGRRDLPEAYRK
ncbi:MAG: amidohydrolase family protein [Pseudomonadota bacterium]|nr:amidohydrolase family protein [Pseudomonadota bacterium]